MLLSDMKDPTQLTGNTVKHKLKGQKQSFSGTFWINK